MTDPISNERLAEILAGLEGVTPGPWFQTGAPWFRSGDGVLAGSPDGNIAFLIADTDDFAGGREEYQGFPLGDKERDAAHISRCDPDTIRSLIEEVQASRRQSPAGVDADDETYEIGKRDGYEKAIQDLDLATGGDGEFRGSTFPGETVGVPVMKSRIIDRFSSLFVEPAEVEQVLPCDVALPPSTVIRAGCQLSTLHAALVARGMASPPKAVTTTGDWLRDTAMNVMLATEVEEAIRILTAALSSEASSNG